MAGEALPDATNTSRALQYVQGQAVRGHFKGHSTALLVLYYLVSNMWVHGEGKCEVMEGKSSIDAIADGTALSRRAVQNAVKWLATEEWIDTQRQVDGTGREVNRLIYVKLNKPGHQERERRRQYPGLTVVEGSREGARDAHPRVHQVHTPRVHQVHTIQR